MKTYCAQPVATDITQTAVVQNKLIEALLSIVN